MEKIVPDPRVQAYYERIDEADRLLGWMPTGVLEFARTKELLLRHLQAGQLRILDVGGGPGIYASWLADLSHEVHVVDPVPLHIEQAGADERVTAILGDARALPQPDNSADVVLLMGPLYHLPEADDRALALGEARRVLRPGGMLAAAVIARFAALSSLMIHADMLHEPDIFDAVTGALRTGHWDPPDRGRMAQAYFHLPEELLAEVVAAGFDPADLFGIEGPGHLRADLRTAWEDPVRRESILRVARVVESDPSLLAANAHVMAIGWKPQP